jgi:hypothetical protein
MSRRRFLSERCFPFKQPGRLRRGKHWSGYMRASAICSAPLHESGVACEVEAVSSIPKSNPWNSDEPFSYKQIWFGATVCQERINRKIAGENIHWLEYVWKKYMAPQVAISAGAAALRCVILSSSERGIELRLCEKGFWGWEFGNEYKLSLNSPDAWRNLPPVNPRLGTRSRGPDDSLTTEIFTSALSDFARTVREIDGHRMLLTGNSLTRFSAYHMLTERTSRAHRLWWHLTLLHGFSF